MCWRYFPRFLFSLSYHRDRKQMLDLLHTPPSLLNFLRIKMFLHQTFLLFLPPVPEYCEVGMNVPPSFFHPYCSNMYAFITFTTSRICEYTYMASSCTFLQVCVFFPSNWSISVHYKSSLFLLTAHRCINKALSFPSLLFIDSYVGPPCFWFPVEGGVQQAVELSLRVEVLSSPLRFVQQLSNANSMV